MKLWVDDIRNAPDESWTVARTVTSAIRAIARFEFESISLDHDISHQVTVGSFARPYPCDETFMAVAYYIVAKYKGKSAPNISIHSSNLVAGDEMLGVLNDGEIYAQHKPMGLVNRLEMEI